MSDVAFYGGFDADFLSSPGAPLFIGTDDGLAQDAGFDIHNMVAISLFTDRRAADDDPYDDERMGWFGDTYGSFQLGSRLWLLRRSKATAETIVLAESYAREALQWLIDYGFAKRVDVTVARFDPATRAEGAGDALGIVVSITRGDGSEVLLRYPVVWATVAA